MALLPNYAPFIKQIYMPRTKDLPAADQAWVKIDMGPSLTGELLIYNDTDNQDVRFMKWLAARIKEWSYAEADGTIVPISFEAIQRLPKEDYLYLFEQHVKSLVNQVKPDLATAEKKS